MIIITITLTIVKPISMLLMIYLNLPIYQSLAFSMKYFVDFHKNMNNTFCPSNSSVFLRIANEGKLSILKPSP